MKYRFTRTEGTRYTIEIEANNLDQARARVECGSIEYVLDSKAEFISSVEKETFCDVVLEDGDCGKYELFDDFDSHGGPYFGLTASISSAKSMLKGNHSLSWISIRERTKEGVGGFGKEVKRITRSDAGLE